MMNNMSSKAKNILHGFSVLLIAATAAESTKNTF